MLSLKNKNNDRRQGWRTTFSRKLLPLLVAAWFLSGGMAEALEGDFSGNGQIDVGDAVAALQGLTGGPLPLPPTFTNTAGMTFTTIAAGNFVMGSPAEEEGRQTDEVQRTVSISSPFYLQTTEVTQGQWHAVMGSSPAYFAECGNECPVESVSWEDAQSFISALNTLENTTAYRLPTEAEWEYAARAGTTTATSAADLTGLADTECQASPALTGVAWYCANAGQGPHPVGRLAPNAWGLYDMHGNVWEWTMDGYTREVSQAPAIDPVETDNADGYVYRSGGWSGDARTCRSADRDSAGAATRSDDLGFRVARDR